MQRVPGPRTPQRAGASARERFERRDSRDGVSASFIYALLLGLAVFFFVLSLSTRQVTEEEPALELLRSGIATLTDIDVWVAEYADDVRELGASSDEARVPLPGYPLDVTLTRQEAVQLTDAELRATVLEQSARMVYRDGLEPFDRTGNQSLGVFSGEGLLETLVGQISETTYNRANIATMVFGGLVVVLAAAAAVRGEGYGRMGTVGWGALAGAFPGVLVMVGARYLSGIGGSDPFSEDVRTMIQHVVGVPLRNYVVVSFFGLVLAGSAMVLALLGRRVDALRLAPREELAFVEAPVIGGRSRSARDDFEDWDDFDDD